MDGLLLQTLEGLENDETMMAPSLGAWDWLQGEKEAVAREILSDGPICHTSLSDVPEADGSEDVFREIEWRHRALLESRLRDLNEALDRLKRDSYGRCVDCGSAIDVRRLRATPEVTLCIGCQKSIETEISYCTL